MLVSIGSQPRPEASDLLDKLLACHERIRSFTSLAQRLAASTDTPLEEVRAAAASVRRYFVEALPKHVREEEELVAAQLRGRSAELDAALAAMSHEHGAHEPVVARLVATCSALEASPERLPELARELATIADALATDFAAHLAAEEQLIFPALRS